MELDNTPARALVKELNAADLREHERRAMDDARESASDNAVQNHRADWMDEGAPFVSTEW